MNDPSHHRSGRKTLWFVLILSSAYLVAEVVGGVLSGSLALLADAGHMATDVGAIALGIFASWIAQRPATAQKTYGYYRAEILAALLNGATLVAIAIWILFEAWQRFTSPAPVAGPMMTLIAAGGLVVNLLALWITHRDSRHSLNVRAVWLHVLSDALGSAAAVIAGVLVWRFGWMIADPVISVVIALLILRSSWTLLLECVNVLLEGVPAGIDIEAVRRRITSHAAVAQCHDLHVWTLTSGLTALSVHVQVSERTDHAALLTELTCALKQEFGIEHATIQVEPVDFEHPALDRCHR